LTVAPTRVLAALAGVALALFSIYGFICTFEPGEGALAWRIGYSGLFFLGALLAMRGLRPRPPRA